MFCGSTAQPRSSSKCLSKLSFKRVRKTTALFRRLGELVSPRRREELEQTFRDQGIFDYTEQTAQVCLCLPVEYSPLTDSHLVDTVVRRSTPFGESSVLGLYLKRHVYVYVYVALVISEVSFLSNFLLFGQRMDDRFILERDWTEDQPDPD